MVEMEVNAGPVEMDWPKVEMSEGGGDGKT